MGQTTSKQKISKASNSHSTAGPSNQIPASSTPSPDDGTVASSERPKRSRRSTIRRSIVGLVAKPKASLEPTQDSDLRSDAPLSSRKGWRRISRALSLGATEDGHTALASVRPNKKKGKERAVEVIDGEGDEQPKPSTSSQHPVSPVPTRRQSSSSLLTNPAGTGNVLPEPITNNDIGVSPPPLELVHPPPPITPAPTRAAPPQDPTPSIHPPLDQSQPAPRHFPPPGTLVVVQGVVNTIDTGSAPNNSGSNSNSAQTNNTAFPTASSRPNSGLFSGSVRSRPSTPTGEHPGSRNSRGLSSIIRRPASMFNDSRGNTITEGDGTADAPSPGSDSTNGTSDVLSDSTAPTAPSDPDTDNQTAQQRPLSPGSIDVLGTLLSVAAAATAASLFSPTSFAGRTEPLPDPNIPRPTSPTPTAGLGVNGFRPLDTLAELGFPMERDLGTGTVNNPGANGHNLSRERLRGAWDSLRERLGLRDGRNNPGNATPEPFGDGRDAGRTGTGEAMITEMARVLGTGLGLQEEGPGRQTDGATPTTPGVMTNVPSIPPPEGTFERFLYNLQADLRIVLSEDASAEQPTDSNVPPGSGGNEASAITGESSSDTSTQVATSDHGGQQPLAEASDSTEAVEPTETPGLTTPTTSSPPTQNPPIPERRLAGGINLWRSYRFPPIIAPPRSNPPVSGVDHTTITPRSPSQTSPLAPSSEGTRLGHPPRPDTPVPSSSVPPQAVPSVQTDVVVPVIIVGLQSVNIDPQRPEQSEEGDGLFAHPDNRGDGSVLPAEPWGYGEDGEQTMRGRPWHTRAADALRNLRPGRRNGSSTTNANDRAASRTFLIYVIGGYYPPNHHIVTGTDGMDSYDALWELAALIGQVKPPTATPEDIEKSGLRIIKSTDIPQYATEDKVASNCIDRCMICLDDYEPEQDLRLMSCKHFFHQNCVDKWLQVGRNSCPACRMKGVSTTADQESSSNPISPTVPAT